MEKIKFFIESEKGKDIITIIILILVGITSFELGRLSKQDPNNGLKIEFKGQEANAMGAITPNLDSNTDEFSKNGDTSNMSYFASKKGKKYYSTTCTAGKTIKQDNRIYFPSADAANNAGYELSSSCK